MSFGFVKWVKNLCRGPTLGKELGFLNSSFGTLDMVFLGQKKITSVALVGSGSHLAQ